MPLLVFCHSQIAAGWDQAAPAFWCGLEVGLFGDGLGAGVNHVSLDLLYDRRHELSGGDIVARR